MCIKEMILSLIICLGGEIMKNLFRINITGRQIHALRKEQRLSRGDLCRKMRIHGICMSRLRLLMAEIQLVQIYDRELYTISKILNVSIEELFRPE